MAIGRFAEMKALDEQVKTLEESLEVRKAVDRAKGILMDELGWKENESFTWIRAHAMHERIRMLEVANQIIDGSLRPPRRGRQPRRRLRSAAAGRRHRGRLDRRREAPHRVGATVGPVRARLIRPLNAPRLAIAPQTAGTGEDLPGAERPGGRLPAAGYRRAATGAGIQQPAPGPVRRHAGSDRRPGSAHRPAGASYPLDRAGRAAATPARAAALSR